MNNARHLLLGTALLLAGLGGMAQAAPPGTSADGQLAALLAEARQAKPSLQAFSAERGHAFFKAAHGGDWSCASCHTDNPAQAGAHVVTKKRIEPLAPAANPKRFTDPARVDKWFRRNCKDVLSRACSAEEKGDVLAYLLTVRP
ncbi:MAG: hypothetical protein C0489_04500 [Candidatus Accumulibacter sp.]|nr:hypothetical protein [Accumulibacter sp.]MBA4093328.1 hypothetical protein [Accumulibacter sp.]